MTEVIDNADVQTQAGDVQEDTQNGVDQSTRLQELEAQLVKERADREKRENRYKSTKKKETKKDVTTQEDEDVDLDTLVDNRLNERLSAMDARNAFMREKGMTSIPDEVLKIKSEHPNLTREQALKLSPQGEDSKLSPNTYSNPWRTNHVAVGSSSTITNEKLSQLPQAEYVIMRDRIAKGEVVIK